MTKFKEENCPAYPIITWCMSESQWKTLSLYKRFTTKLFAKLFPGILTIIITNKNV